MTPTLVILIIAAFQIFHACCQMSPEPEPHEDGLYFYSAGVHSTYLFPLTSGLSICPDDYPLGFNVKCKGNSHKAKFYVNSKLVRIEKTPPYFLAGSTGTKIHRWTNYPKSAWIRCTLYKPLRSIRAFVTFKC